MPVLRALRMKSSRIRFETSSSASASVTRAQTAVSWAIMYQRVGSWSIILERGAIGITSFCIGVQDSEEAGKRQARFRLGHLVHWSVSRVGSVRGVDSQGRGWIVRQAFFLKNEGAPGTNP